MMKCKWSMDRQIVGSTAPHTLSSHLLLLLLFDQAWPECRSVGMYNEKAPSSHLEREPPSFLIIIYTPLLPVGLTGLLVALPVVPPPAFRSSIQTADKKFMLACTFIASLVKPLVAATTLH